MKRLPIDLPMRTLSTKVSVGAYERVRKLKDETEYRMSDIVSACLLYMPEDKLIAILEEQSKVVDALPKSAKGILRNIESMSDEDRKILRDILE